MSEEEKVKDGLAAEISDVPIDVTKMIALRENSKGHFVPENLIEPVDLMRDDLVQQLIGAAKTLRESVRNFKHFSFDDIAAFVDLSAEKYEVKIKSQKGNMTFHSFNGKQKIVVQTQERISFDERMQAAKALFDKCVKKWSEGGNENLAVLIRDAFNVDKEGNIDARRILALRRHKIEDGDWKRAMQAIGDAVQVIGSKAYIRFYEKDENDDFQAISLDFAGL